MKLKELYKRNIDRPVNPAISVTQPGDTQAPTGERISDIEIEELG